jgi:serine/threonine-protein kinase RsbW
LSEPTNISKKEIVVKSTTDNLAMIREFIKNTTTEVGISDEIIDKIILAVDEACTNIIKHAYKYSPEGQIYIATRFADSKFTIAITDEGQHFDPDKIPVPDLNEYYKQKRIGGLGMFLIKKLMDEVNYSTLSGNKNRVVLVKYLPH